VYPSISDTTFTVLCHVGAFLNALAGMFSIYILFSFFREKGHNFMIGTMEH
jgi:hypothetical protein